MQVRDILYIFFIMLPTVAFVVTLYLLFRSQSKVRQVAESNDELTRSMTLLLDAGEMDVWRYNVAEKVAYCVHGELMPPKGTLDEVCSCFPADDAQRFRSMIDDLVSRRVNKTKGVFCTRYPGCDDVFYIEKEMIPVVDPDGKVRNIIGTHRDVTDTHQLGVELDEEQKRARIVLDIARMTPFELDIERNIMRTFNDPLERNEAIHVHKMTLFNPHIHPDHQNLAKKHMRRLLRGTALKCDYIAPMKFPNGEWRYMKVVLRVFSLNKETGKPSLIVGYRRDVTEEVEIRQRLEEEKHAAQKADRLKTAFLESMSHEIRTPLNAIVGFSDLLISATNDSDRQIYVDIVRSNNELLLNLLENVLNLSKIEAGVIALNREKVDFVNAFNQMGDTLRAQLKDAPLEFIVDNPYKKCKAVVDMTRITQVMSNFTSNAVKNTEKGHVRIGYRVENNGLRLFVEDTGVGIEKESQQKIFDRFVKLDSFKQGTGIGLSICKALVDNSKGHIDVVSSPGEGATFSAWIPCEVVAS